MFVEVLGPGPPDPRLDEIRPHSRQIVSASIPIKGGFMCLDVNRFLNPALEPSRLNIKDLNVLHYNVVVWIVLVYMFGYFRCSGAGSTMLLYLGF